MLNIHLTSFIICVQDKPLKPFFRWYHFHPNDIALYNEMPKNFMANVVLILAYFSNVTYINKKRSPGSLID